MMRVVTTEGDAVSYAGRPAIVHGGVLLILDARDRGVLAAYAAGAWRALTVEASEPGPAPRGTRPARGGSA